MTSPRDKIADTIRTGVAGAQSSRGMADDACLIAADAFDAWLDDNKCRLRMNDGERIIEKTAFRDRLFGRAR